MSDNRPATSTVRNALAIVGAVEDLLRPGREGTVLDADTAVDAVNTIVEEARELRPHQVTDVLDYLEARRDTGALSPVAQPIRVWQVEEKGDEHPAPETDDLPSMADYDDWSNEHSGEPEQDPTLADTDEREDPAKDERAAAAVDELVARVNAREQPS